MMKGSHVPKEKELREREERVEDVTLDDAGVEEAGAELDPVHSSAPQEVRPLTDPQVPK